MGLPALIEYLLAQEKSTGEPLCYHAGWQMAIPSFPPNSMATATFKPSEGEYAYIAWHSEWEKSTIPMNFTVHLEHRGIRPFDGFVLTEMSVDGWQVLTEGQPFLIQLTNNSNLNQFVFGVFEHLVFKTNEDFELMKEILAKYAAGAKSELLAREANTLLRIMAGPASRMVEAVK